MVAALQLLEMQGMTFAEGEIETLSSMEDFELVNALSARMSREFKEQWETLALQIIRLVVTAADVRNTIDKGSDQ